MFSAAIGCQSTPEILNSDGVGTGASGNQGGNNGDGDFNLGGGVGDGDGDTGSGGTTVTPCGDFFCRQETHCELVDGEPECVPNTCEELGCSETEECVENSLGAFCDDLSCEADVDCASERFCDVDEEICKDDVCTPGARSCSPEGEPGMSGDAVYVCRSNGGGFRKEVDCGGAGTFNSVCVEPGIDVAGCGCEDDWDCPGFQECEAGLCQGSVEAPDCRLEPANITDVLPEQELVWGTAPADNDDGRLRLLDGVDVPLLGEETGAPGEPAPATLSAWSNSTQVTVPPIVANMDDDNGDGLIDERDVPEIVFLTFTSSGTADGSGQANNNGTLRVIHGGGTDAMGNSKKGRDYLSVCGDNRWFDGKFFDEDDMELGSEPSCGNLAELDPAATVAVGDLNFDGIPEIVAFGEEDNNDNFETQRGRFSVFDNTGRRLIRTPLYDAVRLKIRALVLPTSCQAQIPMRRWSRL